MNEKLCELRVEKQGEHFVVLDQDGRKVKGMREITVNQRMNDVLSVTVEFIPFKDGQPLTSKS